MSLSTVSLIERMLLHPLKISNAGSIRNIHRGTRGEAKEGCTIHAFISALFFRYFFLPAILLLQPAFLAGNALNRSTNDDVQHLLDRSISYLNINTDSSKTYARSAYESAMRLSDSSRICQSLYLMGMNMVVEGDVQGAYRQFTRSLQLARRQNQHACMVDNLLQSGEIHYNRGEYELALKFFIDGLRISRKNNLKKQESASLHQIGKHYHSIGLFQESLEYYQKSLQLARQTGCPEIEVSLYTKIGKHYETLGNFARAIEYFLLAEKELDIVHDRVIAGTVYNHLGNIYHLIGKFDKAVSYHQLALETRKSIGYREGMAKSLKNLGEVLLDMHMVDSAYACTYESYLICKEIEYKKGMIKAVHDLGEISEIKENYSTSMRLYQESMLLAEEIGYDKGYYTAAIDLGSLYYKLGNIPAAMTYLDMGLIKCEQAGIQYGLMEIFRLKYQIYKDGNDFINALKYHEKYTQVRSKLNDLENRKQIEELQIAYDSEKKEKQNVLLRKDNELKNLALKRKNSILLLSVIILALLLFTFVLIYSKLQSKRKANRTLAVLNNKILRQNKNLSKLNEELNTTNYEKDKFFSIIAHELRNPLWWFRNLAEMLSVKFETMNREQLQRALQSLDESAKTAFHLIENLLLWSRAQLNRISFNPTRFNLQLLIGENIKLMKSVMDCRNIRLAYDQSAPPLQVYADRDLINTVIRNLLSNAIKYTPEKGVISIGCTRIPGYIKLEICDTGIGISEENLKNILSGKDGYSSLGLLQEKGTGLGLMLCKEFVGLNGGKMDIKSEVGRGTFIKITIPKGKDEFVMQEKERAGEGVL